MFRAQRHGLIVAGPIANIFDTCLRQMIDRIVSLSETRPEPAGWAFTRKLLDYVERAVDHIALILELMHGLLIIAVGIELPSAVQAGFNRFGVRLARLRVERDGRRNAEPIEHAANSPESHTHSVFVPAPIWMIGLLSLALRR